jgi:hypothetical protein
MILETPEGRYLATTEYRSYLDADGHSAAAATGSGPIPLTFHRSRYLGTTPSDVGGGHTIGLAMNGRKGRRVGCVMGAKEGAEVEVWDMDGDEGDDDEDDAESDERGEDESM